MQRIIMAMLLAVIPCVIDSLIHQGSGPETKYRILEFGVGLLALFSLPRLLHLKKIHITLPEFAAFMLIAYFFLRAVIDPNRGYAVDHALQTISWITFALLASWLIQSPRDYIRLLSVGLICQLFPIIYAIVETFGVDIYFRYWLGKEGYWTSALAGEDRALIWSSLGNPNYFAIYAALILIALVTLTSTVKRRWIQALLCVYAVGVFYTLIYSFSRGVWVSLFGAFASIFLFLSLFYCFRTLGWRETLKRYSVPTLAMFFVLVLGVTVGYTLESMRGGGPLHQVGKRFYHGITFRDASLRARPLMWTGALRMWREKPLIGQGHGQYQPQYLESLFAVASEMEQQGIDTQRIRMITNQMNTIRSDYSHNDYIQFLAETGMIGYSLYVLLILTAVSAAVRALWLGNLNHKSWKILLGCMTSVMLVTFHCLYDFPLRLPASALWFSFALAGILRFSKYSSPAYVFSFPRWARLLCAISVLTVVLITSPLIYKHYKASHLLHSGVQVIERADRFAETDPDRYYSRIQYARRLLEVGRRLYPDDGRILVPLGHAYMRLSASAGENYLNNALSILQSARATYNTPELYETLGMVYLNKAMFSAAKEQAEKLLLINDKQENVNYLAGLVEYSSNRPEDALNYFYKEVEIDPKDAKAWAYIGAIYQNHLAQPNAAVNAYKMSADIAPNVVNTHFQLGELYGYKLNQYQKASHHYTQAMNLADQLKNETWRARIRVRLQDVNRRIASESETMNE
ncbi:MAG: O-antigen ligase family protein [Candidatus Hinthialibacter antarcticus]|nr:O-antigen ligase family protein [Candidatus Hinthialibacter antarcticus]